MVHPTWFSRAVSADQARPLGSAGYVYDSPEARLAVAAAYLRTLFRGDDAVLFATIDRRDSRGPVMRTHVPRPWGPPFLRHLDGLNRDGHDVFVAVNTVRRAPHPDTGKVGWGRTRAHVSDVLRLQVDFDRDAADSVPALRSDVLAGVVPCPDVVVRSSPSKYQCLWNLPRGDDQWTADAAEFYNVLLASRYGADPTVYPVSQVMRVPGFVNRKHDYVSAPPLVRPCALPARDWYRPEGMQVNALSDFEPLQSVVRPVDLERALEKFPSMAFGASGPEAVARIQEHFRGDIAYSTSLHTARAGASGMDPSMVLAAGAEAAARIVERQDAADATRRDRRERAARASGPSHRAPDRSAGSPAAAPPVLAQPGMREHRADYRRAVRDGSAAQPREVWVMGRNGLPQLRVIKPTASEQGFAAGLHDKLPPSRRGGGPANPGRTRPPSPPGPPSGALPSQLDHYDWGLTLQFLEDGYAPRAVATALARRRTVGEHKKHDPRAYAHKTVKRAVEHCRRRAAEAGRTWEPGTLGDVPASRSSTAVPEPAAAPAPASGAASASVRVAVDRAARAP